MPNATRRPLRPWTFLLPLAALGAGCTSTRAVRPNLDGTPPKTVSWFGDRASPTIVGDPGEGVVDDVAPEPRRGAKVDSERISGRVLDGRGDPVADATVRLAEGASPGGRVVRAKTDPSGGFTLRNLHKGDSYTVVAEDDSGQVTRVGYAEAEAADTGVVIALGQDAGPNNRKPRKHPKVEQAVIRNQDPPAEDDTPEPPAPTRKSRTTRARANDEDIPQASDLDDSEPEPPARKARTSSTAQPTGWRRADANPPADRSLAASAPDDDFEPAPPPRKRSRPAAEPSDDFEPTPPRSASRVAKAGESDLEPLPPRASAKPKRKPVVDDDAEVDPLPPARPRTTASRPVETAEEDPPAAPRRPTTPPRRPVPEPDDDALGAMLPPARSAPKVAAAPKPAQPAAAADPTEQIALAFARSVGDDASTSPASRAAPRYADESSAYDPRPAAVASAASPSRDAPEPPAPADVTVTSPRVADDLRAERAPLFARSDRPAEPAPPAMATLPETFEPPAPPPAVDPRRRMTWGDVTRTDEPPISAPAPAPVPTPEPSTPEASPSLFPDPTPAPETTSAVAPSPTAESAPPIMISEGRPAAVADPTTQPLAATPTPTPEPAPLFQGGDDPILMARPTSGPTPAPTPADIRARAADAVPASVEQETPPPLVADETPPPFLMDEVAQGAANAEAASRLPVDKPGRNPPAADAKPAGRPKMAAVQPEAKFDPKVNRVLDFQLPDLQGRPVRLADLNADFILLDFWGTWCAPCLNPMPHLNELQRRHGTGTLRVVGIACEKGAVEDREDRVLDVIRRVGIGFPILMDDAANPSPLVRGLKVQSFPTMVLLDRSGNVLWRGNGTSPMAMSVLDRAVDKAIRSANKSRGFSFR